jgi:hypothetical protein
MRLLSTRLIVSLILGITVVSAAFSYYEALSWKHTLRGDLEHLAALFSKTLAGNVEHSWNPAPERELQRLLQRFGGREHIFGVAIYRRNGDLVAVTPGLKQSLTVTGA